MAPSLDDAEFLAGSPSRSAVLEALVEAPSTLAELEAAAGASRTTLWRTLTELERRGWAERGDDGYAVTPVGAFVAETFAGFLAGLDVADELGDLIRWLPREEMDFDLVRLADAEVAVPTPSDPQAPMRLAEEQTAEARSVRILSHATSPAVVETLHEGVGVGDQVVELVVTAGAMDAMATKPGMETPFHELLEMDGATVYRSNGEIPHIMAILDGERVGLGVDDEQGRPLAVLDIADPVVLEWAEETFEAYRDDAERFEQ